MKSSVGGRKLKFAVDEEGLVGLAEPDVGTRASVALALAPSAPYSSGKKARPFAEARAAAGDAGGGGSASLSDFRSFFFFFLPPHFSSFQCFVLAQEDRPDRPPSGEAPPSSTNLTFHTPGEFGTSLTTTPSPLGVSTGTPGAALLKSEDAALRHVRSRVAGGEVDHVERRSSSRVR